MSLDAVIVEGLVTNGSSAYISARREFEVVASSIKFFWIFVVIISCIGKLKMTVTC